ncbi:hypothetical protein JCM3770_005889 [Rhodotorula araucariae]
MRTWGCTQGDVASSLTAPTIISPMPPPYPSSGSGSSTAGTARPATAPIAISSSTASTVLPLPRALPARGPTATSVECGPVDGPLLELMPAFSVSESVSSSEGIPLESVRPDPFSRPSTGPPGRRMASGASIFVASPPRSSPLSRSVGPDGEELLPWRRFQTAASPFGSPASPPAPGGPSDPTRLAERQKRRRSSTSLSSFSALPATSRSFCGSFEDSLLSGRMSTPQSSPLPFVASIGVLGSADTPRRLRCPKHLHVSFGAVFYREPSGETMSCPYVGVVDLDAHYHALLVPTPADIDGAPDPLKLPRFPGYQVPVRGQVQLVLKNSLDTPFKPFLIPYDLTGLERGGHGGRTFLRQKSYTVEDDGVKGKLRFAVHLQFCSPPTPHMRKDRTAAEAQEPRYYLYRAIRVVFASRGLDLTDKLRVVHEGPGESLHGAHGGDIERFGAYAGPGLEWDLARKKAKERLKLSHALDIAPAPTPLLPPPLNDTQSPLYPTTPASASAAIPAVSAPAFHLAVPSPFTPSPLVRSASPARFPPSPEPLTFERVPSPRRPAALDRTLSTQSGLSASRPASAAGRSGSGERERIGR